MLLALELLQYDHMTKEKHMVDTPGSRFTSVNATPLGIRYVLLKDVAPYLRDECEVYARGRRALLLLPDGAMAVFYEEWLDWQESLQAAGGEQVASEQAASGSSPIT